MWYHISDVKKTDMVKKLICQLPDYDAFGRVGRLSFDPERVQYLGWTTSDQDYKFNPDRVSDPPTKEQRSHPMQLRSALVNEITGVMGHLFVYGTPLKLNVMNIFPFVFHHII